MRHHRCLHLLPVGTQPHHAASLREWPAQSLLNRSLNSSPSNLLSYNKCWLSSPGHGIERLACTMIQRVDIARVICSRFANNCNWAFRGKYILSHRRRIWGRTLLCEIHSIFYKRFDLLFDFSLFSWRQNLFSSEILFKAWNRVLLQPFFAQLWRHIISLISF